MKNLKKYIKGLTLIELIVVITILSILTTIAFISFQNYTHDARDANRIVTIKNIEKGLELFTIKTGNFPVPDEANTFTGGLDGKVKIHQGIVGDSIARILYMSSIPLDPNDKSNYIYSTFGDDNKYYQVAINTENAQTSFFPQTFAFTPTSTIVKGNYKFDPSLPSLIVVPSSVTGSGLFDPNVCFIVDGGKNTLNNCVEKKEQMNLKDFDSSLIGYWDMETCTGINGDCGVGEKLKDMSGNDYNGVFSGSLSPEITLSHLSKGLEFNFLGLIYTEKEIDYNESRYATISIISKSSRNTGEPIPILLESSMNANTNTGSYYIIDHYMNICESGKESVTTYTRLDVSVPGYTTHGLVKCSQRESIKNEYKLMTFIFDFYTPEENSMYINGKRIVSKTRTGSHDGRPGAEYMINRFLNNYKLYIGSRGLNGLNGLNGIIDDVKIYNRALTDEEIIQQAKITGLY